MYRQYQLFHLAPPHRPWALPPWGESCVTDDVCKREDKPAPSSYNRTYALARMQALRSEGLTLEQIATRLNTEGVATKYGKGWQKGIVCWFLQQYCGGTHKVGRT